MEGVDRRDTCIVQVGEDVAQEPMEVVVGVGAPLGCGEERRSVTTAASEPVAQLDVAYGRGGVDGVAIVEGETRVSGKTYRRVYVFGTQESTKQYVINSASFLYYCNLIHIMKEYTRSRGHVTQQKLRFCDLG